MSPIITGILSGTALAAGALLAFSELKRDMMMLQQNSYRRERYTRWLSQSGDSTSATRILGIIILFAAMSMFNVIWASSLLIILFGTVVSTRLLKAKYKKPLVWTPRARRIYATAGVLTVALTAVMAFGIGQGDTLHAIYRAAVTLLGCYCGSHIIIMAALELMGPVDRSINRGFVNDAVKRLRSHPDLTVVGITGSYGKTSTKHYLHRILSEHFETLMTPGSYNTTLGVVRTVREMLKPYHQVFICEMGAKQLGDIKEICDIVNPTVGVVTAVGPQHLESFGSLDNVCRTKFELVDALPADGLAVVNDDFEAAAARRVDHVACQRYGAGDSQGIRYTATDVSVSAHGTTFTVHDNQGRQPDLQLTTHLVGECNITNLLAAVIVARHLGVPDNKIVYAVQQIQPVEHRLSIKRTPGGVTILDDAFNSNPVGSRMALEVLHQMPGRGIVVTPGMIELGQRTHELNADLGEHIGRNADVAIIVGQYNREAIAEGLKRTSMPESAIHYVDSFAAAQALLQPMLKPGDTVLYENDLPDTFK